MKSFNLRRFWHLIKWDFQTNRNYNLRHWFTMLTLFFFAILLPHACVITEGDEVSSAGIMETISEDDYEDLSADEREGFTAEKLIDDDGEAFTIYQRELPPDVTPWADRVEDQHAVCAVILLVIAGFYFTFSASTFLNNISTKQKRITYLSLPASRTEKLLSRWLYAVPFWLLMMLSAFVIADLFRYAVQPIIGQYHPGLMITWLWSEMGEIITAMRTGFNIETPEKQAIITAFLVWIASSAVSSHSTYLLGSALFPKLPWLLTTGALWVISSVVSIALVSVSGGYVADRLDFIDQSANYLWTQSAIQFIFSVACYILIVVVFRRVQVINHKYINV